MSKKVIIWNIHFTPLRDARSALRDALERTGRFSVVGSTGDGNEALRLVEETAPDVLALDLILPGLDGLGILRRLDAERRPADSPLHTAWRSMVTLGYFRVEHLCDGVDNLHVLYGNHDSLSDVLVPLNVRRDANFMDDRRHAFFLDTAASRSTAG